MAADDDDEDEEEEEEEEEEEDHDEDERQDGTTRTRLCARDMYMSDVLTTGLSR